MASASEDAECKCRATTRLAARPVSRAGYLEELNRRLRLHRDYTPGMRFVSRRDGRGFDWEPNGHLHPFAEISREVRKQFVIVEGML